MAIATLQKKEGFQGQKAVVIPRRVLANQVVNNGVTNQLYITDIGHYPRARYHYRERAHGADQVILAHCVEGRGEVIIGDTRYVIEPGHFFVIPAKTGHTYFADANDPWTIYWVHFKGPSSGQIVSLIHKQFKAYKGFIKHSEKTIRLFNDIYSQLERGYSSNYLLYANLCLWHYLATFIHSHPYDSDGEFDYKNICDVAIEFMGKKTGQVLPLEKIAGAVNLSPSHFSFIFKKKTGFTPIEYFNHLKVQKACQYLLFTGLRVKEIAFELGIEDPYYFSRMFRKVMGMSPNEYREKRI
jgi:AraC-type DNA-binding domain-containing proteins